MHPHTAAARPAVCATTVAMGWQPGDWLIVPSSPLSCLSTHMCVSVCLSLGGGPARHGLEPHPAQHGGRCRGAPLTPDALVPAAAEHNRTVWSAPPTHQSTYTATHMDAHTMGRTHTPRTHTPATGITLHHWITFEQAAQHARGNKCCHPLMPGSIAWGQGSSGRMPSGKGSIRHRSRGGSAHPQAARLPRRVRIGIGREWSGHSPLGEVLPPGGSACSQPLTRGL